MNQRTQGFVERRPDGGDVEWFQNDRFGLFVTWGLYALAARHEWVKSRERMTSDQYDVYFRKFDPDLYDPALWARAASDAGMRYVVAVTKHHEGFCLWDSKLTDYKATNTPAKRDLLRPLFDAFRAEGMRLGAYYSLLDWHHPHYTVDHLHPLRGDAAEVARNEQRDMREYARYVYGQTHELLTQYGKIDMLWYDYSFEGEEGFPGKSAADWNAEALIRLARDMQPDILINDRLHIDQDFKTPEQIVPRSCITVGGKRVVWETCQTFSGSWGYHRDEASWKSVPLLVEMLLDAVSKGGNLLLNVGPTGRGEIDERALDRLAGIGRWMRSHSRAIYGCTEAPPEFVAPRDCRFTYNPLTRRLYLHVLTWPFRHLHLDGFAHRLEYAQLLHDASEIKFAAPWHRAWSGDDPSREDAVTLELPVKKPDVAVPVIELFLK